MKDLVNPEVRSLLGTLDRRHVEAMLNALAAGDGAALMACVAQLDERAPNYGQALGELAAAIQRMALLQALGEMPTEDEEQDAALAALDAGDVDIVWDVPLDQVKTLQGKPNIRAESVPTPSWDAVSACKVPDRVACSRNSPARRAS